MVTTPKVMGHFSVLLLCFGCELAVAQKNSVNYGVFRSNPTFCPTTSNTAIVMDASGSISTAVFLQAKELIIDLVVAMTGNPNSRQAVYVADESPQTVLNLQEQLPLTELVAKLQGGIQHKDGYTWMESAILLGTEDLVDLTTQQVSMNLVILSDGNFEDKDIFGDPNRAALAALEKFVNIFVVAIGDETDMSQLESLTDEKGQVYNLNDVTAATLHHDICYHPLPPPETTCRQPNDIILLVDTSGSMTKEGFDVAKDLVRRLLRGFMEDSDSRQGVIQFSSEATLIFGPADVISPYQKDRLVKRKLVFEDEYTEKAIVMAREILLQHDRGVPKLVILLTDGKSDFPEKAIAEAQQALEAGLDIFAVKCEDAASTELIQITDYDERIFNVGDEVLLSRILNDARQLPSLQYISSAMSG